MGHLCPGLNENTNFTIFRRFAKKNRGRSDFSHFTIFRYLFVFLTQPDGASEVNKIILRKLRKIAAATISPTLRFFVTFLLFPLTRWGLRIQQILRQKRENLGPQRFFALNDFSLYFVFLAYQTTLPNGTNSAKIEKKIVVATMFRTLRFLVTSLL